jgi:hypothetical protein
MDSAEAFAADLRKANAVVEVRHNVETRAATQDQVKLSFKEYPR